MHPGWHPRNRQNKGLLLYYQKMADLLGVYWEFHKQRIKLGNIEFANDFSQFTDLQSFVKSKQNWGNKPVDIVTAYAYKVDASMQSSRFYFLRGNNGDIDIHDPNYGIPRELKNNFFNEYIKRLMWQTHELGKLFSGFAIGDNYTVGRVTEAGLATATDVVPQLDAIFGKELKTSYSLMMAKVLLVNNQQAQRQIGLSAVVDEDKGDGDFNMLDPHHGLNKKMLEQYGLGNAVGCPAALPISNEVKRFLYEQCHVRPTSRTMLEDFAKLFHINFNNDIRKAYDVLPENERVRIISQRSRDLLEGRVLEAVKCPFPKERR